MSLSPNDVVHQHGGGGGGGGAGGGGGGGRRKEDGGKRKASEQSATERIPSRVAQLYYKHGLFLSSFPTISASFAIIVALICSYPLLNIPLPGTIPTKVVLPYQDMSDSISGTTTATGRSNFSSLFPFNQHNNVFGYNFSLEPLTFPWARIDPFIYVQQILVRSSVVPWNENMQLTDAFRGPLHEVFKLLELITNHEDDKQNTLNRLCLHVENIKRHTQQSIFPEYNCLVLSPANFWQQNLHEFNKDTNVLNTIFRYHNFQKSKVSTAEMLFGMPLKDTGLKRYPMRVRQRTLQYAITLVLKENNLDFIQSLREKLMKAYPLHQETEAKESMREKLSIMYIYYPSEFNLFEFGPLCIAFGIVFVYLYLTVRKIEVIRSRFALALGGCIAIFGSLIMSLGFCFFFGLTISTQSKGVYPYLVLLVGLENTLVLTKSVLSTDETLDVKIRVAQGLSKEGWSITKNLLTEITILTVGLATFVPVIQEFCIFAIVGLASDFFVQMSFFSTLLALDIKRVEYTVEVKQFPKMLHSFGLHRQQAEGRGFYRSRSHPKLTGMENIQGENDKKKIPKRLKIAHFWARTRVFQRGFMIWMVLWISSIIYSSGLIEKLFIIDQGNASHPEPVYRAGNDFDPKMERYEFPRYFFERKPELQVENAEANLTEQLGKLRHPEYDMNFRLSNFHWSTILKQYNVSMSGRYVTVLPTIRISHPVSPEHAIHLRNAEEKPPQHFQWQTLAVALDPLDFNDADMQDIPVYNIGSTPLYPKTPMEIALTTILGIVSVIVITYSLIVIYRCICTRNYAEWRASWGEPETSPLMEQKTEHVLDAVPIQVNGHGQKIECVVTDGTLIASSCLQGLINIWDANNGSLMTSIDRRAYFQSIAMTRGFYQQSSTSSGSLSASPPDERARTSTPLQKQKFRLSLDGSDAPFKQIRTNPNSIVNRKTAKHGFTYLLSNNNYSGGNVGFTPMHRSQSIKSDEGIDEGHVQAPTPIWCLDFQDNLIVIGCSDGRIEVWEGTTGTLKCIYENERTWNNGITSIKLAGDKVIACRLNGRIDFLRLETYTQGRHIDWSFTSAYRRTHTRTNSAGSIGTMPSTAQNLREELRCILEGQNFGHQQPVTCIDVAGCTVLTGSQDHTLKVFRLETSSLQYTLHGHCGPITSLFIDRWQNGTAGSGSQDGLLCVWDLITGACIYKLEAHDDSIVSLAYSPSYIISLGLDERLRVWERFQGHLLNTINVIHPYSSLLMLTPSLLVTGRPGSLIVWDVRNGEPIRDVKLDYANQQIYPKNLLLASSSVVCDYGNQLRIVKFPLVAIDKCD